MPELPDLEVFRENIFKRISSKRLSGLEIFNTKKVICAADDLIKELTGQELLSIGRVGKELWFSFSGSRTLAVHLMLSGKTDIISGQEAVHDIRFKICALEFEHESVVFSDPDGLCTVRYMPQPDGAPDAFDDRFDLSYLLEMARKKTRTNVKSFLTDQKVVKGIGNAYADEILWAARISPHSLMGKIPQEALKTLHHAIGSVLRSAIASIREISPDIISGEERSFLKVHNRRIKKTETGYPVMVEKIASKTTYYTDEQVRYL